MTKTIVDTIAYNSEPEVYYNGKLLLSTWFKVKFNRFDPVGIKLHNIKPKANDTLIIKTSSCRYQFEFSSNFIFDNAIDFDSGYLILPEYYK